MDVETLAFRRPRLVALILLVLISAGLSSIFAVGRQEDPTITNLFATVTTAMPGADPGRVEALVTAEIEEALRTISQVETVTSFSGQGVSVVSVELLDTLAETEITQAWSKARDAVAEAAERFPPDARTPDFDAEGISAYSAVVAVTATHPGTTPSLMLRHAEALADRLRALPATRAVDLFGTLEEEVRVEIGAGEIAALGLTIAAISDTIRKADGKVQAGRVQTRETDVAIGVAGEVEVLDRLRVIPLLRGIEGDDLRLGDVATISRGARTPPEEMALVDGRRAVLVGVLAQDGVQIDRWMASLKADLRTGAADVPFGMSEDLLFDQSTYTLDRLRSIGRNMAFGMALVVGVLVATLGFRSAALVALTLPVVTLASLASMNLMGLPVHQMSITGLIVALGLLVDAAIVMTDEIRQRLEAGMERRAAVGDAVRRLFAPLAASTVTTALSFMPMILLPGPSGDFVGAIAIAVVTMLFWSLIVALTVTPALAGRWLRRPPGERRAGRVARGFAASLAWSVRNPVRSMSISLVLPVLGFSTLPYLTAQFFPAVDRDQFHVELDLPVGSSIEATYALVEEIDARLRADPGVEGAWWSIGRSGPAFYYNIVSSRSQMPGYAEAMVTTTDARTAARLIPELQADFDRTWPQAQIIVRGLVQGPPVAAPVELRLVGPDVDTLRALGDNLRRIAADLPVSAHVRTTIIPGAPRLTFEIDESKAHRLGLGITDVAAQMQAAWVGVTGGSLVEGTRSLPIRVRLDAAARHEPAAIWDLPIVPRTVDPDAGLPTVPLSEIATPRLEPSDSAIMRRNGERTNTVQVFLVPGVLPADALARIETALAASGFTLPTGYRMEIGGDSDARASTVAHLAGSLWLVGTLMVATIALTLDSFRLTVVAVAVAVLSAGGALLSLALMQFPFGINALVGVIGSVGVSVNAAIIILTGLQRDADAAAGGAAQMAQVTARSARHILSTTLTTVGGFLPLILAGGGFWPPFAMAVAGGVALSTVVSFYFVPAAFALVARRGPTATAAADAPQDEPRRMSLVAE